MSFENSVVHNYSNGFHTNKETIFKEGAPHNDFTFSNKLTVRANERIQAGIGLKYYYSKLRNQDNYLNKSDSMIVAKQEDKINEFNFSPFFKFVKNSIVLNIKNFNSYYTSTSNFSGFDLNDELYDDSFKQLLSKLEVQFDYTKKVIYLQPEQVDFTILFCRIEILKKYINIKSFCFSNINMIEV